MFQNKISKHRHIAVNNTSANITFAALGTTNAGTTTLMNSTFTNGAGLAIALNDVHAQHVLVSYSIQMSSKLSTRPWVYASTVMSATVPTTYNAGQQSCPLHHDISEIGADATGLEFITLTGEVLIPVLAQVDGQKQYVGIGASFGGEDGSLQGQITQYDSEYSFYQPSK